MIAPVFERLSKQYTGRARFIKVDVDAATDIARQCSVSAMPTFHMYKGGSLVVSFSGADQNRLAQEIERHAPSTADVSFGTPGQRLGEGSSAAGSGMNRREAMAAAAAKRLGMGAKTQQKKDADPMDLDTNRNDKKEEEEKKEGGATNDSRLKVNQSLLTALVNEMGFPKVRAEKALILTGNKSVEAAVEWCFAHEDDPDIDEPLQVVTKEGSSKPKLSPEEAKKKADELYAKARAKREAEEKKEAVEREKNRVKSGKGLTEAKREYEAQQRKRMVEERKREKLEAKKERERVKAMLEADKQRRREKFKMPGAAPSGPAPSAKAEKAAWETSKEVGRGKVQFRMPDGSRIEAEFGPENTMQDLVKYLGDVKPDSKGRNILFAQQYPRRRFAVGDYGKSLAELNLLPRGALNVTYG